MTADGADIPTPGARRARRRSSSASPTSTRSRTAARRRSASSAPTSRSPTSTTRRGRYVEPLAQRARARRSSCRSTSQRPGELEAVFEAIASEWGRLDILVHSIAFAPKEDLQGGLLDCSAEGFAKAMDVSCHSFVRMARLAAPLMTDGGTMFAMSYHGAQQGRAELQRDGAGEGRARGVLPLSRLRARARRASACTRSRPGRSRRAPRPG